MLAYLTGPLSDRNREREYRKREHAFWEETGAINTKHYFYPICVLNKNLEREKDTHALCVLVCAARSLKVWEAFETHAKMKLCWLNKK